MTELSPDLDQEQVLDSPRRKLAHDVYSRLLFWILSAILLVAFAGAIIFFAETYRLRVLDEEAQEVNTTSTTL